jgi:hypothetical protein
MGHNWIRGLCGPFVGLVVALCLVLAACGSTSSSQPVASGTGTAASSPAAPATGNVTTTPPTVAANPVVPNSPPCRELSLADMARILGTSVTAFNQPAPQPELVTSCGFEGGPRVSGQWTYGATVQYRCGSDGLTEYQALMGEPNQRVGQGVGSIEVMIDNGSWFFSYLSNHCLLMISPRYDLVTSTQLSSSYPAVTAVLNGIVARQPVVNNGP